MYLKCDSAVRHFQPGEGPSSLVGAFSVITNLRRQLFETLLHTPSDRGWAAGDNFSDGKVS